MNHVGFITSSLHHQLDAPVQGLLIFFVVG